MTFWDFAKQHPFITLMGLFIMCVMLEAVVTEIVRRK